MRRTLGLDVSGRRDGGGEKRRFMDVVGEGVKVVGRCGRRECRGQRDAEADDWLKVSCTFSLFSHSKGMTVAFKINSIHIDLKSRSLARR